MSDHKTRERKVDMSKMTIEQADRLSEMIGQELAKIMDEANRKCNEMLNIYGLQTQIHYQIVQIEEKKAEVVEITKEKKKRGRKPKKDVKEQSLTTTETL